MKTYCRLFYRIPFSETDAMKIVHHTNHARYLERGRIEFLRLVGFDYTEVMKRGLHFPVTEISVEYKRPLVFDEIIMIETSISLLTRVRLNFSYKVYSVGELATPSLYTEAFSGKPSFLGETFHCCVNDDGRPVEASPEFHQRMLQLYQGDQ